MIIRRPIKFDLSIEDVKFDINNCVAIGMITSEIISNAIKYAFTDKQNAVVAISLVYNRANSEVVFSISDNGIGLSQSINQSGLGMRLIDIFSRQMEAEYESKNEKGLKYIFTIPYQKNE
jgi:two-component sensor histidine kinase